MKNLLAKFYNLLACRVTLAIVATATVANAHDLPQHFPLAPTDWGMIQQDCMGYQSSSILAGENTIDFEAVKGEGFNEITIAEPDQGNPPEPLATREQIVSQELIGPALYDGVDCAKLESYYRNSQSDQRASELVVYKPQSQQIVDNSLARVDPKFEFHKSFFAACSCDFENRQANQSILPPKLTFKRTYVEDFFANNFVRHRPLVLRDFGRIKFTENQIAPLALAIPLTRVKNKQVLSAALSELASYDCIARSEFYSSQRAFQFGELAATYAKTWFSDAIPTASSLVVNYANNLKPTSKLTSPAPMFVVVQNAAGNDVAIPILQARNWEQTAEAIPSTEPVAVSQEFKALVDSANSRIQWAGGRLSAAANYMNDWFSDRIARVKTNDLR